MNFFKRSISDPIRGLTLDRLSAQIDAYQNGYLAEFALTAEAMENRDDMLKNVITKRKKAVTRHGWEILLEDCSDEARLQRDALDFFYRNLTCTHALRPNERGGFQLLIYQMMDAVGKGYAVHEILWKPIISRPSLNGGGTSSGSPQSIAANSSFDIRNSKISSSSPSFSFVAQSKSENRQSKILSGPTFASSNQRSEIIDQKSLSSPTQRSVPSTQHLLTAQFRFVPLWYFEAITGPLRFLTTPGALHGQPMAERDWLVTTGDALMIACSRAFLFKHYPLQAWLDFSEKFGLPGVRAITSAARGTPEFAEMEDALQSFMKELSVVTNTAESIDVIDLKGSGQPPFAELVERMDRVMASLWRGADLSTLSRDRGYGATLQEQESRILEMDDARMLSEHLNSTLDRWVLEQLFGPSVPPLARVKILVTPQECTPHDLAIDQFLIGHGARLPLSQTLERYGRVQAKPDEPALSSNSSTGGTRSPSPKHAASETAANSDVPSTSHFVSRTSNLDRTSSFDIRRSPLSNNFMKTELHNSKTPQSSVPNRQNPVENDSSPRSVCSAYSVVNQSSFAEFEHQKPDIINQKSPVASLPNSRFETTDLDGFVQLSPLGIFPHRHGFQNVDRTALETLVKNFKSFFGRLGRRFAGLPFYIGHPDVPGYENVYSDRKAYGWIMDLEVREDGLYGRINWSAAGRELIANGHFKFLSPYWEAIKIGERSGRGVFSPTVLKSVGLTNEPNLPVLPLANTDCTSADLGACLGTSISLTPTLNLTPAPNLNPDPTMNSSLPETGGVTSIRAANVSDGASELRRAWEANLPVSPDSDSANSKPKIQNSELPPGGGTSSGSLISILSSSPETSSFDDRTSHLSETGGATLLRKFPDIASSSAQSTIDHDAQSAHLPRGNTLVADLGGQNRKSKMPLNPIQNAQSAISNEQPEIEPSPSVPSACSVVEDNSKLSTQNSKLDAPPHNFAEIERCIANCQREIATLNHRLVTTLLDNAIAGARILPIERSHWECALHENFEETSAALANAAPKLNLTSRTESLPRVNAPLPPGQKQKRILTLVYEQMRATNSSFHQAWLEIRADQPNLFTSES